VIAKKDDEVIVVQVKKYAAENKVGAPDVQKLLGSMWKYKATRAIFITTSDFTQAARAQTANAPIELWNGRKLYEEFLAFYCTPDPLT